MMDDMKKVTVCSACLCASCWQGEFYCEAYKTAGTVEKTVRQLRRLSREHPCYFERTPEERLAERRAQKGGRP